MARELTLTLERKSGHIHDFSATIGDKLAIAGDGQKKRTAKEVLVDAPVHIRVVIVGMPGSEYSVTIDLPGRVDDFSFKSTLAASIQHVEFDV